MLLSANLFAQHHGLGFKIGEPMALTYKNYLPNNKALEFVLGTSPKTWDKIYYGNSFENKFKDYDHYRLRVSNIIYTQVRYVIHHHINTEGIDGKLDWYWGVGVAYKKAKTKYDYTITGNSPKEIYVLERTDVDFGPEVIGGLEYTMQNAPISIFTEFSTMLELADRFTARVVGGLGARVNF
jgi:hypothetical protein